MCILIVSSYSFIDVVMFFVLVIPQIVNHFELFGNIIFPNVIYHDNNIPVYGKEMKSPL